MNRAGLVAEVAEKTGFTKLDCENVLDTYMETIIETVADGEKVTLYGFGTFEPVERAAKKGRNPKTGESLLIPSTKTAKFKVAKAFKESVKEGAYVPSDS